MTRLAPLLALALLAGCPSGVVGTYVRSQEGVTLNSRQKCESAAEVVRVGDRAVELLRREFLAAGLQAVDQSEYPSGHLWLCVVPTPEGCGPAGTGAPMAGCCTDSVVKVARANLVAGLIHEIAHALDRTFDAAHSQQVIWGPLGIVARVTAMMQGGR